MPDETEVVDHREAAKDAEVELAQKEAATPAVGLQKGDRIPSATERVAARASDTYTKHAPDGECGITGSHPYDSCGKVRASQARANAEAATRAAAEAENSTIEGNADAPGVDEGGE